MKKNIISYLSVIIAALTLILSSCSTGGKSNPVNSKMLNFMRKRISCELRLDADQKKVLDETCLDINNKGKEFEPFFQKFCAELINQIENDKFDQEKLNKISTEYQYLFDEMRTTIISGMAKLHNNLTEDQRKKLADRLKNCYNKKQCKINQ